MIRQTVPWASGKQKTAAPAPPKRRRRRRKMSNGGKALAAFWTGFGLILLGCAQIFEMSALMFAGATSFGLTAATVYFEKRQNGSVPAPNVSKPKPAKPPGSKGSGGRGRKPGTAIPCRRTGQPIDQCNCAKRHVATAEGARRFKRQIGDPLGGGSAVSASKPTGKPVSNGQRLPVGEVMRREY